MHATSQSSGSQNIDNLVECFPSSPANPAVGKDWAGLLNTFTSAYCPMFLDRHVFAPRKHRGRLGRIEELGPPLNFRERINLDECESSIRFVSILARLHALASAQKRFNVNLHEGEVKARKILAEKAAKEGKTLGHAQAATSSATVKFWSSSIYYDGYQFPFSMLGTDPREKPASTVIPVYVIPVKLVLPDGSVWDPATVAVPNRANAIDGTINSPIFGKQVGITAA